MFKIIGIIILVAVAIPFLLYIYVRVISSAWYKSKSEYINLKKLLKYFSYKEERK